MERQVFDRLEALEGEHWWFAARRSILSRVLDRVSDAAKRPRILEAGVGTGGNLAMLRAHGEVTGFEHDEIALDIARARAGDMALEQGTLPGKLPAYAEPFDVVVAFDVIEHVEQDEESLAALREKLAPGGRLVMTVPAFPFLWSRHDETHHHFRRYTRRALVEKLELAGFQVEHSGYFNSLLSPLVVGARFAKRLLGLTDSADDAMPPKSLNALLRRVFASERHWVGRLSVPFGVSLLAVARRP